MADNPPNIPRVPAGPEPMKKTTGKVAPKKETVRISLPPKPSAAPTIKLPTLPPGGPTGAASADAVRRRATDRRAAARCRAAHRRRAARRRRPDRRPPASRSRRRAGPSARLTKSSPSSRWWPRSPPSAGRDGFFGR